MGSNEIDEISNGIFHNTRYDKMTYILK